MHTEQWLSCHAQMLFVSSYLAFVSEWCQQRLNKKICNNCFTGAWLNLGAPFNSQQMIYCVKRLVYVSSSVKKTIHSSAFRQDFNLYPNLVYGNKTKNDWRMIFKEANLSFIPLRNQLIFKTQQRKHVEYVGFKTKSLSHHWTKAHKWKQKHTQANLHSDENLMA